MSHLRRNSRIQVCALSLTIFVLIFSLASCRKPEKAAAGNVAPKTFASPEEAGTALVEAMKSGNQAALIDIFGPDGKEVLFTEDSVRDRNALKDFAIAYETMNRWGKIDAGGQMLYVGVDNFPFPIPLQQNSSGRWYFNTEAGEDEILARRIGKDELTAIAALGAIANAQQQYFQQSGNKVKQYAQKFVSDEGTHNGLYWPAPEGSPNESPLGRMGDFAKGAGYTKAGAKAQPFNGYYFRILTKQADPDGRVKDYIVNGNLTGGFAVLAFPAEYRNTGIMTFLVGKDGIVYQKDLGERTADNAIAISEYNPRDGWQPVNP